MNTEHDPFADAVTGDGYKAWKEADEPSPSKPAEAAPAPAPAPAAAEPAQAAQDAAGQPRNPDGTFAPKAADGAQAPAQAPERLPFEGFDKLDPAVQNHFRRLASEAADFKERYIRVNGQLHRYRRGSDNHPAARSTPAPAQAQARADNLADARTATAALPAGAARDAAQEQLDRWEAHVKAYPDDAAAIDQRIQAFNRNIMAGIDPLKAELQQLRDTVKELRGGFDAIESERAERRMHEAFETIGEIAGDNWRQICGFEDEHGNRIPDERRQWHPEFAAWVNGHDPDEASYLWETLRHPSPRVVGGVIARFNREVFALDNPGTAAPSTPDLTQRRQEALRDTTPRTGGARTTGNAVWTPSGDPYADAIAGGGYDEWKRNTA